jgi:hypothetical protein
MKIEENKDGAAGWKTGAAMGAAGLATYVAGSETVGHAKGPRTLLRKQ